MLIVSLKDWFTVTLKTPSTWLIALTLFWIFGAIVLVKAMQSDVEGKKAKAEQEKAKAERAKAKAEKEKARARSEEAKAEQNKCRLC